MNDASALLTAVAHLLLSFATFLAAVVAVFKIEKVHKATNSMKDELVASTRSAAHASGVKEEHDRAKAVSESVDKDEASS
jgi:hypothetical protein